MTTILDGALPKLKKILDDTGVHTYAIVMRDPDDGGYVWTTQGSRMWRMGALQGLLDSERRDLLEEGRRG